MMNNNLFILKIKERNEKERMVTRLNESVSGTPSSPSLQSSSFSLQNYRIVVYSRILVF